jgi:membrane protease YdiL (CAAX protease family)
MRSRIQTASTGAIAAAIAVLDILLWTSVIPFELFAHKMTVAPHPSSFVLIAILVVNALFLAAMFAAGTLTVELLRRGVTLKKLFSRYSAGASALRSGPIQTD